MIELSSKTNDLSQTDIKGLPSKEKIWKKYYTNIQIKEFIPQSLYDFLYSSNKAYMNQEALYYFGKKISFTSFFNNVHKTEKAYWNLGVRQGDVVAICSVNTPEIIFSIYALNHLGAVINLIDPRSAIADIKHFLQEGKSHFCICIDKAYERILTASKNTQIEKIITVSIADSLPVLKKIFFKLKNKTTSHNSLSWKKFIKVSSTINPSYPEFIPDTVSVMAHTGGTTGKSKTVLLSSENLNAVAFDFVNGIFANKRGDKFFNDLPPFIIFGLSVALHSALCIGHKVIIHPKFDSEAFPKQFIKYKPNSFVSLSGHLKVLIRDKKVNKMDLSFVNSIGIGGDSLNIKLEQEANDFFEKHNCKYKICKGYGMTELAAAAVISSGKADAPGSIGIPLILNNIKIIDLESENELTYNQKGEICISGPSVMLGYLDKLDETKDRFFYDENGIKWLHTGDLGYIDKNGLVYVEGRLRRFYLSVIDNFPVKIFPGYIEKVIKHHKFVFDACAVGKLIGKTTYYEMIVFVIKSSDCTISDEQLISELNVLSQTELPPKMIPAEFRLISEFPLTPVGKIDYRKLEEYILIK